MHPVTEFYFYKSLFDPVDLATMVALAAVMLIFHGEKEVTLKETYLVMIGVGVPVAMWMTFARGMEWPLIVRYAGLYVVCGVLLYTRENFTLLASLVGAGVLSAANAGCAALVAK